jgi:hypothetical protein
MGATRTPAQLASDEKRRQILRGKREVAAATAIKAKKKTKIPAIRACCQSLFVPPASLSLMVIEENKDRNKDEDENEFKSFTNNPIVVNDDFFPEL